MPDSLSATSGARIDCIGDSTLLLTLGDHIDAGLNERVHVLAAILDHADVPGLLDIVPAYASIAVHYDMLAWQGNAGEETAAERLAQRLSAIVDNSTFAQSATDAPCIEIPVCYDGEFALDLDAVADHAQLGVQEVIARHCAPTYRVAMLGFAPGFPYLLGLDPALAMPRRASPRTQVPAGSVAIGGAQTGIYPSELPGGWQIIGRTPRVLFDVSRDAPALLKPGQTLRFQRIDAARFTHAERENAT